MDVVSNSPEECRYVLESLAEVYGYDAQAEKGGLSAEERLRFHQAQRTGDGKAARLAARSVCGEGSGGRPVHESYPHLRIERCQCLRLPHRTAETRAGGSGESVCVDAVELPGGPGRERR